MRTTVALLLLALALPLAAGDGKTVELRLDSKILGEKRTILVRLPPTYAEPSRRYPVLYLTDGEDQLTHTATTVDFLSGFANMPELILVGITHDDRRRDLTANREKFLAFIATELIPEIESRYRTHPYRIFAGYSLGGSFALYMREVRPELFRAWIAVSPSNREDDHAALKRAQEVEPTTATPLFLSAGNEAVTPSVRALHAALTAKGGNATFDYFPDDDHFSVPLPAHYAALRRLFAPWFFSDIRERKDVDTLWARANAHCERLSKDFGFPIPVPELVAHVIGRWLALDGMHEQAVEVFRANVRNHPDSKQARALLAKAQRR